MLTKECADRYAQPQQVARKLLQYTYRLGRANRAADQSAAAYVRLQLDRLGLGAELTAIRHGPQRAIPLPPSRLTGVGR